MDKIERRFTVEPFQVRVADGDAGKTTITGRAVIYNSWTQIGPDYPWGWEGAHCARRTHGLPA